MTSKLAAVNEILEGIGDPHVTALDTGGASDEGEAEVTLDRESRRVQETGPGAMGGWWFNTERKVALPAPSLRLVIQIFVDSVPPVVGETIVGQFTGGVGVVSWFDKGQAPDLPSGQNFLYIRQVSGDFGPNTDIYDGQTSGSTFATIPFGFTTITEGPIGVPPDTISIRSFTPDWRVTGPREDRIVVQVDDRLFNEGEQTFMFSGNDLLVDRVVERDFETLPAIVADYVIKSASVRFQRWKKRGQIDDSMLQQELFIARSRAYREHTRVMKTNMLNTAGARRVYGNRRSLESFGLTDNG